nr:putative 12-oxophytodienoate reductase 11 [Tanacetum cinerariifolium]
LFQLEKRGIVEKGRTHDRLLLLDAVHHLQGVQSWTTGLRPTTGHGVQAYCQQWNVAVVLQGSKPEHQDILAVALSRVITLLALESLFHYVFACHLENLMLVDNGDVEIVEAISKERVSERVKIRLSPFINYNESGDSDPHLLGIDMAESLSQPGIAYCHVIEQRMVTRFERVVTWNSLAAMRKVFKGTFMVAVGYHDRDEANRVVENGDADLVAFARVVFG